MFHSFQSSLDSSKLILILFNGYKLEQTFCVIRIKKAADLLQKYFGNFKEHITSTAYLKCIYMYQLVCQFPETKILEQVKI